MQNNKKLETPPTNLLQDSALFLDFDGTLVELAARPEDVIVSSQVYDVLNDLLKILDQRLAIVSGRSVQVLRSDFAIKNITIAGSHGNEIAIAGERTCAPVKAPVKAPVEALVSKGVFGLDHIIADLHKFAASHDGLLIEPKSMGVGLHFRQAPGLEKICKDKAHELAAKYNLKVQAGKMLYEIYGGDEDKGSAITKLCALRPFLSHKPIFIGDDKTDEHGFIAAAAMGGFGILVGPQRDSAAAYRLDDVPAVHAWLSAAIDAQNKG